MLINMKDIESEEKREKIIETIGSLEKDIFKESSYSSSQLLDMSKNLSYDIYIYSEKSFEILGYLITYDSLDCYEIMKIGVKNSERKKGIGSKLLKSFLEFNKIKFKEKDIFLEVRESNISAIDFYKKNGFSQIGVRKGYYSDNNENALIMKLERY